MSDCIASCCEGFCPLSKPPPSFHPHTYTPLFYFVLYCRISQDLRYSNSFDLYPSPLLRIIGQSLMTLKIKVQLYIQSGLLCRLLLPLFGLPMAFFSYLGLLWTQGTQRTCMWGRLYSQCVCCCFQGGSQESVIWMYPMQLHSLSLALFSSIIAPFGGFFASGFKRAFKVKVSIKCGQFALQHDHQI